ncbi:MAG: P1 family peptidase [Pseudomonadota bacterium]
MRIGHAVDTTILTGTTAILFDEPAIVAADIRGGGPGTRDVTLLEPENTVERVDALFLSGGSAFGLDAGGGVQAWLAENGRGFPLGPVRVPLVPGAILFDLLSGQNNGKRADYRTLGYDAAASAEASPTLQGSVGAGIGATTATLRGGLGTASRTTDYGHRIAALAVVNAVGSATMGASRYFWAAPYENSNEFGGQGWPAEMPEFALEPQMKGAPRPTSGQATTLCVVATDAALTVNSTKRLAMMAQDGMARALRPVHTPLDGDIVFAASTGAAPLAPDPAAHHHGLAILGSAAADCVARAIARGVYEASTDGQAILPAYKARFG